MTKYREIIRLTGLGFSQRNIMASCGVSQKTVVKVQKRARELNISWPLDESMTDTELQKLMFSKESKVSANKKMPDYTYIRKELLRNGVSKKLLWTEYMEDCRANGDEPLMYSQFCYHIQQDEQKHRATMHINRKPGEQVEVDWADVFMISTYKISRRPLRPPEIFYILSKFLKSNTSSSSIRRSISLRFGSECSSSLENR